MNFHRLTTNVLATTYLMLSCVVSQQIGMGGLLQDQGPQFARAWLLAGAVAWLLWASWPFSDEYIDRIKHDQELQLRKPLSKRLQRLITSMIVLIAYVISTHIIWGNAQWGVGTDLQWEFAFAWNLFGLWMLLMWSIRMIRIAESAKYLEFIQHVPSTDATE